MNKNEIVIELAKKWRDCGLLDGDTVVLHSDVRRILLHYNRLNQHKTKGKEKILSVTDIFASFLNAVGKSGTLIIPLFNFDFSSKKTPFDIKNTPSQMGVLSEYARKRDDYLRTKNPVYSFAIFGKNKKYFESLDLYSALGKDSVFSRLIELDGKIAILRLPDKNSMTFYHHVEEMHNVPYRIRKSFTGLYIDANGKEKKETISLFVRDLDKGVQTLVDPVGELMWDQGLYVGEKFNQGHGLRTVSAVKMYKFVSKIILSNSALNNLYEINQDLIK